MNRINKTEDKDEYKTRPVQNFPDYLKYVAKKSKAGFGRVHEELCRLYLESFGIAEKSSSNTPGNQRASSTENVTPKSKTSLRQRWSNSGNLWPSAGHGKLRTTTYEDKSVNYSFVSYIPEEKEDLSSSTVFNQESDIISNDLDMTTSEIPSFGNKETRTTTSHTQDKNEVDHNSVRFSMPYSRLAGESIYINDRVVYVEKFKNMNTIAEKEDKDKNSIEEYSTSKLKNQQQISHEIDDYVNLRDPCEPLSNVVGNKDYNSRKDVMYKNSKPLQMNTKREPIKGTVAKQPTQKASVDTDSDDDEYLPPTNWTQSCYMSQTSGKYGPLTNVTEVNQSVSTITEPSKNISNLQKTLSEVRDDINEEDTEENDYAVPAKFTDVDYENIPKAFKNKDFRRIVTKNQVALAFKRTQEENKANFVNEDVEDEVDYDRPVEWIQAAGKYTDGNSTLIVVPKSVTNMKNNVTTNTDNMYTKIVKNENRNSDDGDYSIPTSKKLTAKDYCNSVAGCHYNVPKGIRPVHSGNNTMTNGTQSFYSTPRSTSNTRYESSQINHQNAELEGTLVHINSDNGNRMNHFYNYTVDEVVDCLHKCALNKLANICKEERLDGEFFRTIKTDELTEEPFRMNWYHISKLSKVIGGWRPKHPPGSKE